MFTACFESCPANVAVKRAVTPRPSKRPGRSVLFPRSFRAGCPRLVFRTPEQGPDEFDRDREDDSRALLAAHVEQGLHVAKRERRRLGGDDLGGVGKRLGGLEIYVGRNDLGPL